MTTAILTKGMNLWGPESSVNMEVGEASSCRDIMFRNDNAMYKSWGWRRLNATALASPILAHKGFSYKGKNSPAGSTARGGNYGIANDLANYTRRAAFYSTGIALNDDGLYYWNPPTEAFVGPVALPGGAAIMPGGNPCPTILILQNNAYIVGWADHNIRYDPVDRAMYLWGWAAAPTNAGHTGLQAGGTLVAGATYRYRASYVDIYTGEESELSVEYEATTTAANRTVLLDNFAVYPGTRHYNDAAGAAGDDVGIVVYRSDPDQQSFYFLDMLNPNVTTLTDNGLAVDYSLRADTRDLEDPPVLNAITEFKSMWFGLSWDNNWARVYYNDFRAEKSFVERWDVRDYRELPLQEGEFLTAPAKSSSSLIIFTNQSAHQLHITPNVATGQIDITNRPMLWPVGCVGPQAWDFQEGALYWLSERGPYRWREGGLLEFIGKNVQPMFMDPQSGFCLMNELARVRAKVGYNQDAEQMHFSFPCGSETHNSRHIYYWLRGQENGLKYYQGWSYGSPEAQHFDASHVYEPLIGGVPVTPQDKRERFVFSDNLGFLYEYDPDSERAGLLASEVASGTAQAASTVNTLVTSGGLYIVGDGLIGLRLEVVHADGTIDERVITANTVTDITPDIPFTQEPDDGTWYVGGIPAYWKSWYDHAGEPANHKTWYHMHIGFNPTITQGDQVVDVNLYAGDFPTVLNRARTAALSIYYRKILASLTARFFMWEIANTRPDEPFGVTYFTNEFKPLKARRV